MPTSFSHDWAQPYEPTGEGELEMPVHFEAAKPQSANEAEDTHDPCGYRNPDDRGSPPKEGRHSPFSSESGSAGAGDRDSDQSYNELRQDSTGGDGGAAADIAMAQEALDAAPAEVVEAKRDNAAIAYFKRLRGAGQPGPDWFVWTWDAIPAFVFTGITLMVLAAIEAFGLQPYNKGLLSYLPSFGASCCMVMCLLTVPGAQPRALVLTHICGAFLGVSWAHITKNLPSPLDQQLACAFAVAMLTVLMLITGTMQPSASATTCLAAFHLYGQMNDQGFMFMVAPATLGPLVIVFFAWVLNNLVPWRHCFPLWW